jgi:uncharacterized protein YecE (DUF72 family)
MASKILVGTASWADPGFIADWYPRDLPASERLPYYAAHFNLVELNSSFYAIPTRNLVQRWCDQTPKDFIFDVKLHRYLSRHSTPLKCLPPKLRPFAQVQGDKVQFTPKLERAVAREFLEEMQPFIGSGKLGAFLLQLTPSFNPHHHRLEELDDLLGILERTRVVVELRNRAWLSPGQLDETTTYFRSRQVCLVSVDAPDTNHFMVMPGVDVVSNPRLAYLRLHGRNAKGYVTGKTVAERFDYLYSEEELQSIEERTLRLASAAAETHVIYNNNSSDYALRNATTFREMLEGKSSAAVPKAPNWGRTLEFDF